MQNIVIVVSIEEITLTTITDTTVTVTMLTGGIFNKIDISSLLTLELNV